jgi:hypothetical protein
MLTTNTNSVGAGFFVKRMKIEASHAPYLIRREDATTIDRELVAWGHQQAVVFVVVVSPGQEEREGRWRAGGGLGG